VQETEPEVGSNANETMTLFPSATPAAGTVMVKLVPVLVEDTGVPIVLTKVIAARASELDRAISALIIAKKPLRKVGRVGEGRNIETPLAG